MITAVALAAYAALAGAAAPPLLARARWPHAAPVAAVLAWLALVTTFVIAAALSVHHLVAVERHPHDGLMGLFTVCLLEDHPSAVPGPSTPGDVLAVAAPVVVVLLPLPWLARGVWRARRARARQLDTLTLVGRTVPAYGVTVVDHVVPAVYCLSGRRSRVVVTRGALDVLSDAQLRAVVEHERAHLMGRHHLLHVLVDAFSRAFRGLPLARLVREQTFLLLEMIADDRALRFHSRDVLATAMCEVAAGQTPRAALGAGGSGVLVRLRRVLEPQPRPPRTAWLCIVAATLAAPSLPLLAACGP
ncbi:M56 family metallopeptidase [Streptomyces sp. NPDC014864]|uniref:M56 family metallopeptidase n=1 Tax=Streptomyces sp. NPDC014864 TaxID=3364924 RepID=UPI0037018079